MAKVRELLYGTHDPYANYEPLLRLDSFGWNSESPIFAEVIKELKPNLIIEVGTYFGGSARHMAKLAKEQSTETSASSVEVVCIDTFLGSVEHWHQHQYFKPAFFKNGRPPIYEQFMSNTIRSNLQDTITPFPIDSTNGGLTLKRYGIQADLVYIDGGHEYESVSCDLRIFRDLVRPGGIMLIDDSHHPPIQRAAREQLTGLLRIKGSKILWRK